MKTNRIVANIAVSQDEIDRAASFYRDVLGLEMLMDHGWIVTLGNGERMQVQLSIAAEGGSGAPVPDLSIEVDDVEEAFARARAGGFAIEYGVADEPWGVRRFYVRDPFGKLVNVLSHI